MTHNKSINIYWWAYLGHITKHVGVECKVVFGDVEKSLEKDVTHQSARVVCGEMKQEKKLCLGLNFHEGRNKESLAKKLQFGAHFLSPDFISAKKGLHSEHKTLFISF